MYSIILSLNINFAKYKELIAFINEDDKNQSIP